MFTKLKLVLAATLAIAAAPLAGCGAPTTPAEAATYEVLGLEAGGDAGMGQRGHGGKGGHHGFFGGPFAQQLNLTDAQKAQLKAIAQKHRGEREKGQFKAQREQLRALLSAPQVDGAALKAFFNARLQAMETHAAKRAAMMSEMRAVLTTEQRAQLVKSLNEAKPNPHKPRFDGMRKMFRDRLLADLNLTAAQKATFDALQAKMDALMADGAGHRAGKAAFATFIETGDAAAFQASMKANIAGKAPVDELVAVAVSLDQGQRQKLLAKFERFAGGKGGHGKGGHGGQGGRGHH